MRVKELLKALASLPIALANEENAKCFPETHWVCPWHGSTPGSATVGLYGAHKLQKPRADLKQLHDLSQKRVMY